MAESTDRGGGANRPRCDDGISGGWGAGLGLVAVLCCAAPLLLGTGLAGAALALAREHWGWVAGGAGLVGVAVAARLWRAGPS